jgi:hypothetical protein
MGEDFEILFNSGRHKLNINGAVDIENLDVKLKTVVYNSLIASKDTFLYFQLLPGEYFG